MGKRYEYLAYSACRTYTGLLCFGNGNISDMALYIRAVRHGSGTDPSPEPHLQKCCPADCFFRMLRNLSAAARMVCCVFLYPFAFLCFHRSPDCFSDDYNTLFSHTSQFCTAEVPAHCNYSCGIILYLL